MEKIIVAKRRSINTDALEILTCLSLAEILRIKLRYG